MQELILNKAQGLFFGRGLKTITMDDIAKAAGVSKKTIYESFSNKNEILNHVVSKFLSYHKQALQQCELKARDAVEEVVQSTQLILDTTCVVNMNFFYDLEKAFPEAWALIMSYSQQVIVPAIVSNIKKGVEQELYRTDLDIPFLTELRIQQIATAFHPQSFSRKRVQSHKLMMQLSAFYLHAIATPKGKKLIYKYLNVKNEKQFIN